MIIEQKINFEINKLSDFISNILDIKINDKIIWFYVAYREDLLSEYIHLGCLFGS